MADEPKKGLLSKLKRQEIQWDDQPAKPKNGKTKSGPMLDKNGKPLPFWTVWLNKRKAKKANVRESALPKPAATKEERIKLIAAAVIIILVPIVFIFLASRQGGGDAKDKKAGPNPQAAAEKRATKAAGGGDDG